MTVITVVCLAGCVWLTILLVATAPAIGVVSLVLEWVVVRGAVRFATGALGELVTGARYPRSRG